MAVAITEKDFIKRLETARQFKADIEPDLMEGYFFTAPRRAREIRSNKQTRTAKADAAAEAAELHTTLGLECADDFVGMIIDAFMPPNMDWAKRAKGMLPENIWAQIKQEVAKQDQTIIDTIKASNLYAVLKPAFYPDLSLGTCALWIEDKHLAEPPVVRPVPIRELDLDAGPSADVGARFVTRYETNRDLPGILPVGAFEKLPLGVREKIGRQPEGTTEVNWGFIPDRSVPLEVTWHYIIHVAKKQCFHEELKGEGAMPLVIPRFDVDPTNPWADGPTLKALPYLRVMDAYSQMSQDGAEFQSDPSFIYTSDGTINFEGGLQTGMAYPAAMGFDKTQIAWLRPDVRPDVMMLTVDQLRAEVRRLHYADFPEQRGKTPPTASQWIDEMVKMQKRIGLSGETFWREGPRAIFERFRFLLEQRGLIQPLMVGGKAIPVSPYNPAVKGQDLQEVQTAERMLQTNLAFGGVQGQAAVNVPATMANIQAKLGDKMVVWLGAEEQKELLTSLIPQADVNIGNTMAG